MTLSEYSQLKQQIVFGVGTSERHSHIVNSLKELFRDDINSVRRFEQITTIGQLLRILEIRDVLSEDKVGPLKEMAKCIPNSGELLKRITQYEQSHVPRAYNNYYATEHIENTNAQNTATNRDEQNESTLSSDPCRGNLSKIKKQRIFQTVIDETGKYWRDLARNLKIRECKINMIQREKTSLEEKAKEVMIEFESKADPQKWFFVLCDALERARRRDLSRTLQEIMVMNI